jgi:type VI secretion system protein ImpM
MPEPLIEPLIALPTGALLRGATIGFCGKLPARGDFITSALPRRFVEPWHDWVQGALATSRQALAEDWLPAWNEAPIWRFALSPGVCGADAVLGLWMPSVDRAGRNFPLTFAALASDCNVPALMREGGEFLDVAETAGLDALARDLEPNEIAARLSAASWGALTEAEDLIDLLAGGGAIWWTDGAPRVAAGAFVTVALPDAAEFAGMLRADGAAQAGLAEQAP